MSNISDNTTIQTAKTENIRKDVSTPPTNRGVLSTLGENNTPVSLTGLPFSSRVVLDWVTCSFDYDLTTMAYIVGELGGLRERDRGMMGYTKSGGVLGTGSFCWSPKREHQRMCLVLPSSALAQLKITAVELLQWLRGHGAVFTRIDIAVDDFNEVLDLRIIKEHLINGWCVSRWRTFRTDGDMIIGDGGEALQTTIYIGARASDSFVRVYDKAVEQLAKGLQPEQPNWIRLEIESKRERANEIVSRILNTPSPCEWVSTYINGLIEFKDRVPGDSNKSRWPPCLWWSRFLGTIEKERLRLPKKVRTIETTKKWLWNNVAPNLAMVIGAGEYPAVVDMALAGADRWSEVHKNALKLSGLNADLAKATLTALGRSQNFGGVE